MSVWTARWKIWPALGRRRHYVRPHRKQFCVPTVMNSQCNSLASRGPVLSRTGLLKRISTLKSRVSLLHFSVAGSNKIDNMILTSFLTSLLVCLVSIAPFPGAIFISPLLAGLAVYLSFTRRHWIILATSALNFVTPWVAPASIRSQEFFIYLVMLLTVCAILVTRGQFRGTETR